MKAFPSQFVKDNRSEIIGADGSKIISSGPRVVTEDGMDLRDYFAAAALPGVQALAQFAMEHGAGKREAWPSAIAESAYDVADAMISERGHRQ